MNPVIARLVLVAALASPLDVQADAGHDHGPAVATAPSGAPQRLPDGSVYVPKITQRQLVLRTRVAETSRAPLAFEMFGKVMMDPNAGGKVQSTVAGRVEPGPRGLPSLGQSVKKGDVLAFVRPSAGAIERANQAAQAAELRANRELAEKRVARLQQLEGTVPQKEIDIARAEVASLTERLAAVAGSLSITEALIAPVTGVVASATVVAGQVVDAREVLFEIVDPGRLLVEAVAHDAKLAARIQAATATVEPGLAFPLALVGAGGSLREQALPVVFRFTGGSRAPLLKVGQPLTVLAQTDQYVDGYAMPAAAIVKDRNNQDVAWVHVGAERFAAKVVRFVTTDGATVTIVDGLSKGDRVVIQGASLLNQVR